MSVDFAMIYFKQYTQWALSASDTPSFLRVTYTVHAPGISIIKQAGMSCGSVQSETVSQIDISLKLDSGHSRRPRFGMKASYRSMY